MVHIVNVSPDFGDDWHWHKSRLDAEVYSWTFFKATKLHGPLAWVHRPNLAFIVVAGRAAIHLRLRPQALLVTHDARLTFWCCLLNMLLRNRNRHVAYSFNFPELPRGWKLRLFAWCFRSVSRFVLYSEVEREAYSRAFGIDQERFIVIRWGVNPPEQAHPATPTVEGNYVCAIGGNGRDYATLIEAARNLPDIAFVLVARPRNLKGLDVPGNVRVFCDIAPGEAMNILAHARFMALPLAGDDVPCGHVTLVAAMHLGKAVVATRSRGVIDYLHDGENAVLFESKSPGALGAAVCRLWENPGLANELGQNAKASARERFSEEAAARHLVDVLNESAARQ